MPNSSQKFSSFIFLFLAKTTIQLYSKRFQSTDSFSWSKMHFWQTKYLHTKICPAVLLKVIESFSHCSSSEMEKLDVLIWHRDCKNKCVKKRDSQSRSQEDRCCQLCPQGNNNNEQSKRLTGCHMKSVNSHSSSASASWAPGLPNAPWGTCPFAEEQGQVLQRRHCCKRSDVDISYRFLMSHLQVTWQVQSLSSSKQETKPNQPTKQ